MVNFGFDSTGMGMGMTPASVFLGHVKPLDDPGHGVAFCQSD